MSDAPRARELGPSFQIMDAIEITLELLSAWPHVTHTCRERVPLIWLMSFWQFKILLRV
jgi:hypothetical protein